MNETKKPDRAITTKLNFLETYITITVYLDNRLVRRLESRFASRLLYVIEPELLLVRFAIHTRQEGTFTA